jgi:hypothetical protein
MHFQLAAPSLDVGRGASGSRSGVHYSKRPCFVDQGRFWTELCPSVAVMPVNVPSHGEAQTVGSQLPEAEVDAARA